MLSFQYLDGQQGLDRAHLKNRKHCMDNIPKHFRHLKLHSQSGGVQFHWLHVLLPVTL